MRQRRSKQEPTDEDLGFFWHEIPCPSEGAARAEAQRQNALEDPADAEWIYLRNKSKQWVARRTPRHLPQEPKSFKRKLLDVMVNNLHLEDIFLK